MNTIRLLLFVFLHASFAAVASVGGMHESSLVIDFSDAADAKSKATWTDEDAMTISDDGLGWSGPRASPPDCWIQTVPLPIGLSWCTSINARVVAGIDLGPVDLVVSKGEKWLPGPGRMFVRYSPDYLHWSSWQLLAVSEPQDNTKKEGRRRCFRGEIGIPRSERHNYVGLMTEYQSLDVPWPSDEDAAVRWILKKDPKFFAKQLPFIGYVQFRYESDFIGGQRIQAFNASVEWGSSGMAAPSKGGWDEVRDRSSKPWSFKADASAETAEPGVGADSR